MDATQIIRDPISESDEEECEDNKDERGQTLAKLCILKNDHIPETGEWFTASVFCIYFLLIYATVCLV